MRLQRRREIPPVSEAAGRTGAAPARGQASDFNSAASSGNVYRFCSTVLPSHFGHSTGGGPCKYSVCPGPESAGRWFLPVPSHVVHVRTASMYQSCFTMAPGYAIGEGYNLAGPGR